MAEAVHEKALTETQQKALGAKVTEALWAYEEIDAGLRDKVRDFLVDGDDATCILELAAAYQDKNRKKFFKDQHGAVRAEDRSERRKLFGLFQIKDTPPGYYRRLGEVAGQIPELKQVSFETDDRLPAWLCDALVLRWLLSSASPGFWFYGVPDRVNSFQIAPYLADVEEPGEISSIIKLVIDFVSTDSQHIAQYLRTAGDWARCWRIGRPMWPRR